MKIFCLLFAHGLTFALHDFGIAHIRGLDVVEEVQ
jgi:hypothetical protein